MANPSVAMIPTGFKQGKLYSVLPEDSSGDFYFTRASAASRVNEDGLIEEDVIVGVQLIQNGTFQNGDDWVNEQNTWTLGNGRAIGNGANGGAEELQQSVLVPGETYKYSFEVENYVSGAIVLFGTGTAILADGVYSGLYTAFTDKVSFRGVNFFGDITNVEVEQFETNDIPRLDYTDGGCPVLLLEPQSTQEIEYSESFLDDYWTKSGATIEPNPATAGADQITNGDFSQGSQDWNLAGLVSIGSGVASFVDNGTNPLTSIVQNGAVVADTDYKISFDVSRYVSGGVQVVIGGANAVSDNLSQGVGTYTFYIKSGSSTNFEIKRWGAFPNFDFDITNITVQEVQGFKSPSADRPLSALKLVEDTSNSTHRIQPAVVITQATDHSISLIAKKGERKYIAFGDRNNSTNGSYAQFNLETGLVESTSAIYTTGVFSVSNAKITELSNGYYLCSATFNSDRAGVVMGIAISDAPFVGGNLDTYTYQGDGVSGLYIWGAQFEELSYSTSYMYSDGGIVTRASESCGGSGDVNDFNSEEGVLFAEVSALVNNATERHITLSDGTTNNSVKIQWGGTSNQFYYFVKVGGVVQSDIRFIVPSALDMNKVACVWKQNDFSLWINGVEVGTDILGNTFSANVLDRLSFSEGNQTLNFFGKTSQVQVFKTALSDTELQTLTTL